MRLKYYSQVTSIHVQHSTVYEQRIRVYELTNLMYSIKKYITMHFIHTADSLATCMYTYMAHSICNVVRIIVVAL